MSRLGAIMYAAAIGGIALLFARETLEPSIYLYQESAGYKSALGVVGWLIATVGPVALSVLVWLLVQRLTPRWLVHLAFIPMALVLFRAGSSLFFHASGMTAEVTLGGYAMLAASAFLPLTLLVHTTALVVEGYRAVGHRANGS
ncbi:hypothetical protein D3876_03860 [Sphingomonas cavernae]|uniref:Uncharacterized protein n=1 Tax=Sphingomonas cavernae TaxID=2320861 RepID=A0A418WQN2_9SPHN|nr:hypothetical protein D3876_03860 [Sphingomonas cavernae]